MDHTGKNYEIIGNRLSGNTFNALEGLFGLKGKAKKIDIKDGDLNVKENFPTIEGNSAYKLTIPKNKFEKILSKIVNKDGEDNEDNEDKNLLNYLQNQNTGINFSKDIIKACDINGNDLIVRLSTGRIADATRKHVKKLGEMVEDDKIVRIKDYFADSKNREFFEETNNLFDDLQLTATYKPEFLKDLDQNKKSKGQQIFSDLIGSFAPEVGTSILPGEKNWIDNESGISEDGKLLIVYLDRGWHEDTSDAIAKIFDTSPKNNKDKFKKTYFEIPIEKIITLQSLNKKLNQIADEPWTILTTYFSKEEQEMMKTEHIEWDNRIEILESQKSKINKYRVEELKALESTKLDLEEEQGKNYKGIGIQGNKFAIEEDFLKISHAKVYESSPLGGLLFSQGFSSRKGFIEVAGGEIFIKIPKEHKDKSIDQIKKYIKDNGIGKDPAILCKKNKNYPFENVLLNQQEL